MTSADDPEARIRALEQPLADAARASEISANPSPGKWAPPSGPPMPPPPYGGSFPSPPPLPYGSTFSGPPTDIRSGGTGRWILLGIFVIGVICLPLAIFLLSAHHVSRSGLPSVLPIPSISSEPPTASGSVPHTSAGTPSTSATSATTAPVGGSLSVAGINEIRTVVCRDSKISVSGVGNEVVITGHCAGLNISGVRNKVTVEATDNIQASGFSNDITYRTGTPHVETSGQGNLVHKG